MKSLSLKGICELFISWYISCPLPNTNKTEFSLSSLIAEVIASFLSRITLVLDKSHPFKISFDIWIGSSFLGLSFVTITLSANWEAVPISFLLSLSLLPPAPNKTTTGAYLKELLGPESLFIGTNEDELFSEITNEKHLTSPKLFNILKLLGKSDFKKYNNIILEASSHALDQDRFNGIRFNTSGFTNLSQDHFDYHTNIENYFNSKLKLFSNQLSDKFVYIDNEWGNKVAQNSSLPSFKISSDTQADLQILEKKTYPKTSLKIEINKKIYDFELDIVGPNFYQNFLLAFSMAYYSKIKNVDQIIENISNLKNPKGRFDLINFKTNKIIVDYAHTPESISQVIKYVNPYFSKVVVLFGAGGNRDKEKRKLMGIASQLADSVIVTNDNPRNEEPIQISNDILKGCDLSKTTVILDRKEAITSAINELRENSVLLVLGKGHEMYQEINNSRIPLNDNDFINKTIGGLIWLQ